MYTVIGSCSLCGGHVVVSDDITETFGKITPPTCNACGAVAKLSVIQTEKADSKDTRQLLTEATKT